MSVLEIKNEEQKDSEEDQEIFEKRGIMRKYHDNHTQMSARSYQPNPENKDRTYFIFIDDGNVYKLIEK